MSFVNCNLIHEGQSIKETVISYEREKNICTGISELTITVEWKTERTFTAWDEIILYEEGWKVGTFLVATTTKNNSGDKVIVCQDYSKKLCDWFIADTYEIPDFALTRTWLEFFLNLGGIDYSFTTSSTGQYINNNTVFGRQMLLDVVQSLLQMSGWYMYFNPDGVCIIGELTKDLSNPEWNFDDTEIQKLEINTHDKHLRNRAVVYGLVSPEEKKRVFADISVTTPWDTDEKDKRAVVLSNGYIRSTSVAQSLARKMIDTFATLTVVKTATLVRNYSIEVGDLVELDSDYFQGIGLVTTISSVMSAANGLISIVTLDEKCPRLFGYFGYIVPVYIGTEGAGVWRKPLDSGLWENFSIGLFANPVDSSIPGVDLNEINPTEGIIPDLIIKNSVFACINGYWAYRNYGHTVANWKPIDCGTLTDLNGISYTQASVQAMAVDIDTATNNIFVGYKLREENVPIVGENRSWIVEFTSKGVRLAVNYLNFGRDKQDFELVDVDKYKSSLNLAVAIAPSSYDKFWGNRKTSLSPLNSSEEHAPDQETSCFGLVPTSGFVLGNVPELQTGLGNAFTFNSGDHYGLIDLHVEGNSVYSFGDERSFQYVAYSGDTQFSASATVRFSNYDFGLITYPHQFRYLWREETGDDFDVVDIIGNPATGGRILLHNTYTPLIYPYPVQLNDCYVATTNPVVLSGVQTIDNVSLSVGHRVLVKDQDDATENGVYTVLTNNWRRDVDLDSDIEVKPGLFTAVQTGDVNYRTCWQVGEIEPAGINNTPLVFEPVLVNEEVNNFEISDETAPDGATSNATIRGNYLGNQGAAFFVDYHRATTLYSNVTENIISVYNIKEKAFKRVSVGDYTQNTILPVDPSTATFYGVYNYSFTPIFLTACDDGVGFLYLFVDFRDAARNAIYNDPLNYPPNEFISSAIKTTLIGTIVDKDGVITQHEQLLWDWWLPCLNNHHGFSGYNHYIDYLSVTEFIYELYGYDTSATVKPQYRIRHKVSSKTWATNCGSCPPGNPGGDRTEDVVYGTVTLSKESMTVDAPFMILSGQSRGYICLFCNSFDFTSLALEAYNFEFYRSDNYPLQSKLGKPKCIRKGIIQQYPFDDASDLTYQIPVNITQVSPIMDDIDNGIYIYDHSLRQVHKITSVNARPFGDPAEIDRLVAFDLSDQVYTGFFPWTSCFLFFNGIFFLGAYGSANIVSFFCIKVNDDKILPGYRICYLLKNTDYNEFTVLDTNFYSFNVENSKDAPLSAFTNGRYLLSGYPIFSEYISAGILDETSTFRENVKVYPKLTRPSIVYSGVSDTRIVDLGGTFYTDDGPTSLDYARYLFTAGRDENVKYKTAEPITDATLTNFHAVTSGIANKIETSNYYSSPYTFISTSGTTALGIRPFFYQRNPGTSGWIDYSDLLPIPNTLCIRLDDRV